jgi:hypothetical protein
MVGEKPANFLEVKTISIHDSGERDEKCPINTLKMVLANPMGHGFMVISGNNRLSAKRRLRWWRVTSDPISGTKIKAKHSFGTGKLTSRKENLMISDE